MADEILALKSLQARAMQEAATIHAKIWFLAEALDALELDLNNGFCGAVDLLRHVAVEASGDWNQGEGRPGNENALETPWWRLWLRRLIG